MCEAGSSPLLSFFPVTWTGEWDTPGDAIAAGASSMQMAVVTAMALALARKGMQASWFAPI